MWSYSTIYVCEFSSIGTNVDYKFEILKKGYSGPFYSLTGTSRPVIHQWDTDDPKAPVKGASLVFNFINTGSTPLSSFYDPDDQAYKGRLWMGSQLMFEGFMIQSDSSEILVDYTHEISLSFNDGLGLLREIALNLAYKPGYNDQQLTEEDPFTEKTLLDIIKHCVWCTGLDLDTKLYEQLFETSQIGYMIFLDLTSVNMELFYQGNEKWDDCYTVLEKILGWYQLTLEQSRGAWQIIRWADARYYLGAIPGYQFDSAMTLQGAITLDDTIAFGNYPNTSNPINGINNRILRPWKYDQYQLDYVTPKNFKNADFLTLGTLLRQYTVGIGVNLETYYEYEAPFWDKVSPTSVGEYFIRVIKDYLNVEKERYMVVRGPSTDQQRAISSRSIEVSQFDLISVSFSYRVFDIRSAVFILRLINSIPPTPKYAYGDQGSNNGIWSSSTGWTDPGSSSGEWRTVNIDPNQVSLTGAPNDALLNLFLGLCTSAPGTQETQYKDIKLNYRFKVNDSIYVIGHRHKDQIDSVIKNNLEQTIYLDDCPKNAIVNCTFNYGQSVGLLHKRTNLWRRGHMPTEFEKVGRIIAIEEETWRSKPRTIIEGTVNGISGGGYHISMLTRMTYDQMPGLNFLWGKLSIDYRNNQATGTMWEMYKDSEQYDDNPGEYSFNYIYSNS